MHAPTQALAQQPTRRSRLVAFLKEMPCDIYCAGIAGGLILGFTDIIVKGEEGVIRLIQLALTSVTDEAAFAHVTPMYVILAISVLGGFICWVYQPKSRPDAFFRGMSLFALLGLVSAEESMIQSPDTLATDTAANIEQVVTPRQGEPVDRATYPLALVGYPLKASQAAPPLERLGEKRLVVFRLTSPELEEESVTSLITIRHPESAQIQHRGRHKGSLVTTHLAPGRYQVELAVDGHNPGRFNMVVAAETQTTAYRVALVPASLPFGLHKLRGYNTVEVELDFDLAAEVEAAHRRQVLREQVAEQGAAGSRNQ